jgi:UDP-glucose 4-epimerase
MPDVLITGGGGLVGLNTARAFAAAGRSVVMTARHGHDQILRSLGDLRELVTIEPTELVRGGEVFDLFSRYNFQAVIHGAQAHQRAQTRSSNRANYDMIFNLLEAADFTGAQRFVLISSIAVYGGIAPPLDEDTRFPVEAVIEDDPEALFAFTAPDGSRTMVVPPFEISVKRSLERIALDYAAAWRMGGSATVHSNQRFKEGQLDVAVLRIPTQFGPGYKEMGSPIGLAVHTAAGRGNLVAGSGYGGVPVPELWNVIASSPLAYVRDTAAALKTLVEADTLPHRIYNVSSGYTTSPREQLLTLYRVRPDAAQQVGLDPEVLRAEPYPPSGFTADLLTRDTGWSSQYTFEEAFEDYLKWLSENPY